MSATGPNVCLCFGFASNRRSRTSKDDPYDTLLSGPNVCLCPGVAGDRRARTDPHTAEVSTSGFGVASHPGDLYDTLGARMSACASILLSPQAPYRNTNKSPGMRGEPWAASAAASATQASAASAGPLVPGASTAALSGLEPLVPRKGGLGSRPALLCTSQELWGPSREPRGSRESAAAPQPGSLESGSPPGFSSDPVSDPGHL